MSQILKFCPHCGKPGLKQPFWSFYPGTYDCPNCNRRFDIRLK